MDKTTYHKQLDYMEEKKFAKVARDLRRVKRIAGRSKVTPTKPLNDTLCGYMFF